MQNTYTEPGAPVVCGGHVWQEPKGLQLGSAIRPFGVALSAGLAAEHGGDLGQVWHQRFARHLGRRHVLQRGQGSAVHL